MGLALREIRCTRLKQPRLHKFVVYSLRRGVDRGNVLGAVIMEESNVAQILQLTWSRNISLKLTAIQQIFSIVGDRLVKGSR